MQFLHELANQYSLDITSSNDAVLQSIYQETLQQHSMSHMQSSWVQGEFLLFISNIIQPKYVLEIGTFTGFSAICMAKGLSSDGELHTLELRETDAATAMENFRKTQLQNRIFLHLGNAKDIIPTLDYAWDLVFIDADKTSYTDYYELILPRLSKKGIIIADNVLFHGDVLEEEIKGKNAKAIDAFNKHVACDERTEQVLLTVRDGLLLIRKRN